MDSIAVSVFVVILVDSDVQACLQIGPDFFNAFFTTENISTQGKLEKNARN